MYGTMEMTVMPILHCLHTSEIAYTNAALGMDSVYISNRWNHDLMVATTRILVEHFTVHQSQQSHPRLVSVLLLVLKVINLYE